MVRSLTRSSTKAAIRFSGMPHRPKPPAKIVDPSCTPALLSAALALETILFNGLPPSRPGGRPSSHGAGVRRAPLANVFHRVGGGRSRSEQPPNALLGERLHVLRRHDVAGRHPDVPGARLGVSRIGLREVG